MPEKTNPKTPENDLELRKALDGSELSTETKEHFAALLDRMNNEEKFELIKLIDAGKQAREVGEKEREKELTRINEALKKHLAKVAREQETKTRQAFEDLGKEEDKEVMVKLEKELNNL